MKRRIINITIIAIILSFASQLILNKSTSYSSAFCKEYNLIGLENCKAIKAPVEEKHGYPVAFKTTTKAYEEPVINEKILNSTTTYSLKNFIINSFIWLAGATIIYILIRPMLSYYKNKNLNISKN